MSRKVLRVGLPLFILVSITYHVYIQNISLFALFAKEKNSDPVEIIAFGDSLTEGLHDWPWSMKFHPYTTKLKELIALHHPKSLVEVRNFGKSGERLKSMYARLSDVLSSRRNSTSGANKFVVILAGSNDIIDHIKQIERSHNLQQGLHSKEDEKKAFEIASEIIKLHVLCHVEKFRTLAVSIPEIKAEEKQASYSNTREMVNKRLHAFAKETANVTTFVDLATKIPRSGPSKDFEAIHWDDGIHMTRIGYEKMAEIIYEALRTTT